MLENYWYENGIAIYETSWEDNNEKWFYIGSHKYNSKNYTDLNLDNGQLSSV